MNVLTNFFFDKCHFDDEHVQSSFLCTCCCSTAGIVSCVFRLTVPYLTPLAGCSFGSAFLASIYWRHAFIDASINKDLALRVNLHAPNSRRSSITESEAT
jgi:hypothetical protein